MRENGFGLTVGSEMVHKDCSKVFILVPLIAISIWIRSISLVDIKEGWEVGSPVKKHMQASIRPLFHFPPFYIKQMDTHSINSINTNTEIKIMKGKSYGVFHDHQGIDLKVLGHSDPSLLIARKAFPMELASLTLEEALGVHAIHHNARFCFGFRFIESFRTTGITVIAAK
jgi:hypothetical protein